LPTITVLQTPEEIVVTAGDGQTAAVNTPVAIAPAVQIRDAIGNPVPSVSVTFSTSAGAGQLTDSVQVTDATGTAVLGSWTLGTATGANSLTATAGSLSTVIGATATPGPVSTSTSVISVSQDTVAAGSLSVLTLVTHDAYGNQLTDGGLTVAFSHNGGTSTGSIGPTTDQADGTYTASFTGQMAGSATSIGATIGGSPVTTLQPDIAVVAGAPAQISVVAGDGQTTMVGTRVPIPPTIEVLDTFSNPVPSATVSFSITSGGGSVTGSPTATDNAGIASATAWTLGLVPGFNATATPPSVAGSVTLGNLLLGAEPYTIAVSAASDEAYVANRSSDYVTVIDLTRDSAIGTVTVGGSPVGIAVHRTTNDVYVASAETNVLSVIDGSSHIVTATTSLGETPAGVAIDHSVNQVFVALPASDRVVVFDAATLAVDTTLGVGVNPQWVNVDVRHNWLFVSNSGDGTVTVIDTENLSTKGTPTVGSNPQGVGVNEHRERAYVATDSALVILDKENVNRTVTLPAGYHRGVAVDSIAERVYVANAVTNELLIVNSDGTPQLLGSVPVAAGPVGAAAHIGRNRILVAGSVDNAVTLLETGSHLVQAVIRRIGGPATTYP
jgi:YVTN family beta-propeller protein